MCFLDIVSINQVNPDLTEIGVYGIGGFLSVAKELRILWSVPYMSRLWCLGVMFPLWQLIGLL